MDFRQVAYGHDRGQGALCIAEGWSRTCQIQILHKTITANPSGARRPSSGPWTLDLGREALTLMLSWEDSRATWVRSGAILGQPGVILGLSWEDVGATWGHLGPSWGYVGRTW